MLLLLKIFPHGVGNQIWCSDCLLGHLCKAAFIQFAVNSLKSCTSLSDAVLPDKKMHRCFAILFCLFGVFLPVCGSPQQRELGSRRKRLLSWLACGGGALGAAILTRWHYPGVNPLVRCSCYIMESGKEKGSTHDRGGGGLRYAGLGQMGPALELPGVCDESSTCELQEIGNLKQEFGQWLQEKYFRCQEFNLYCDHCCDATVDKSRPVSLQLNNK